MAAAFLALTAGAWSKPATLPAALKALSDPHATTRREAVRWLMNFHDQETEALNQWISNLGEWERRQALLTFHRMGRLAGPSALPAWVEAVTDHEDRLRKFAGNILVQYKTEAVPALVGLITSTLSEARFESATVLGRIKDSASIPALLSALEDREATVRDQVIWALSEIGDASTLPALEAFAAKRPAEAATVIQRLDAFNGAALPWLTRLAESHVDASMRKTAVDRLAASGSDAIPILSRVLKQERDPSVRLQVVISLARIGARINDPDVIPFLLDMVQDPSEVFREKAVWALGRIHDSGDVTHPLVLPALQAALNDPIPRIRLKAVNALAAPAAAQAVPALMAATESTDAHVRRLAVKKLGVCVDTRSIPVLAKTLQDVDAGVRLATVDTLDRMPHEDSLSALTHAMTDTDTAVRRAAVTAVGRRQQWRTVASLKTCLEDPDPAIRRTARDTLKAMGELGVEDFQEIQP